MGERVFQPKVFATVKLLESKGIKARDRLDKAGGSKGCFALPEHVGRNVPVFERSDVSLTEYQL